jgi:hypothetical protein
VLLAPGNHDPAVPAGPYATAEWTPNVHVFPQPELSAFRLGDGFTVWGAGHDRPAYTPGSFDSGFRVAGDGVHVALFHGAERGMLRFQEEGKVARRSLDANRVRDGDCWPLALIHGCRATFRDADTPASVAAFIDLADSHQSRCARHPVHGEISGIDVVRAYVAALGGSIDVVARLGDRSWKVA